jgi:hypothetical protein
MSQKPDDRGQTTENNFGFRIADLERHGAWSMGLCRHLASPSLSHYASLSFVVRGRGKMSEVGDQRV